MQLRFINEVLIDERILFLISESPGCEHKQFYKYILVVKGVLSLSTKAKEKSRRIQ
jgi:hypothetical protein